MKFRIGDQNHLSALQPSSFKPSMPFVLNYFKEVHAPNLPPPIHVGQSTGLCKFPQTGHIRDGTVWQRKEGEGWRCKRRVLWIRGEILPVADSNGANSSTKDRQTGGQPASLSIKSQALSSRPHYTSVCCLLFSSKSPVSFCHSFSFFFLFL